MREPILTDEDLRAWALWKRVCMMHSRTSGYRNRMEISGEVVTRMAQIHPNAYVAWSAGKDSTAMAHLISTLINGVRAMSIKDDLDFPGETEYVERLASEWGVELDVIRPAFSLQQIIKDNPPEFGSHIHGRTAELSGRGFYDLISDYRKRMGFPGVYLGLRKYESDARLMHRASRGHIYTKRDGETVCQPIADWSDKDVYAYLFSNGIEPLHVYKCLRFVDEPGSIRKSWWLPGAAVDRQAMWLKTYYPSLFKRFRELMPGASQFA